MKDQEAGRRQKRDSEQREGGGKTGLPGRPVRSMKL